MALNPVKMRDDITALRAIAVISVLGFHFGIPGFSGGFIGVDIFFVISGYLISGILIRDIEKNKLSLFDFLVKRAFRLLPALLAIVILTFIAGYFILQPIEFKNNARASISSLFFISNLYFYLTGGYFDAFPITKPLLHTWSLSVESQFYFIWPLVLMVTMSRKIPAKITITLFTIIFFLSSLYAVNRNLTAAYLLTPFRLWELSIGGLFYVIKLKKIKDSKALSNIIYALSLAAIIFFIVHLDEKIVFPGYYALIPTVCTGLMLIFGENSNIATWLERKPIIHIGEISYSLYLTHWPTIVMVTFVLGEKNLIGGLISIPISYFIALLMYYYVEQRYRTAWKNESKNKLVVKYVFTLALTVVISATAVFSGWIWRLPADLQNTNYAFDKKASDRYVWANSNGFQRKDITHSEKIKIVVIGDSQAADVINTLMESKYNNKLDIASIQVDVKCGIPYINPTEIDNYLKTVNLAVISSNGLQEMCKRNILDTFNEFNQRNMKAADFILIAMNWKDFNVKYINETLDKIKETQSNAQVVVIGRKSLKANGIFIFNKSNQSEDVDSFAAKYISDDILKINESIASSLPKRVEFLDLMNVVCPGKKLCRIVDDKNHITYGDETHFTKSGAVLFSNEIVSKLGILKS